MWTVVKYRLTLDLLCIYIKEYEATRNVQVKDYERLESNKYIQHISNKNTKINVDTGMKGD